MDIPKIRAPIVLVHGLFGFNQLQLLGVTLAQYFHDIPQHLSNAGNRVLAAQLSPTKGVADRAGELKAFLEREAAGEPVHILAHSMGGLDARYMISQLGMADRVLSLTTLGTPHRGSSFADWTVHRLERLLKPVMQLLDIPHQAFYDLTTSSCKKFNEAVADAPQVRYFSVAGQHSEESGWYCRMGVLHQFMRQTEGSNDGIVSVASATYGEDCQVWDGDHLSLVGWQDGTPPATAGNGIDRKTDYARLLGRLVDAGF